MFLSEISPYGLLRSNIILDLLYFGSSHASYTKDTQPNVIIGTRLQPGAVVLKKRGKQFYQADLFGTWQFPNLPVTHLKIKNGNLLVIDPNKIQPGSIIDVINGNCIVGCTAPYDGTLRINAPAVALQPDQLLYERNNNLYRVKTKDAFSANTSLPATDEIWTRKPSLTITVANGAVLLDNKLS